MIIKNGIICDKNQYKKSDILIVDNIIVKIADKIDIDDEVFDASGLVIMPSIVDFGISVKDDKLNSKSIKELSTKASKSGFGYMGIISKNTPIISESMIELINHTQNNSTHLSAIADSVYDKKLTNISKLKSAGASSLYIKSSEDGNSIKRVFEYSKLLDIRVFCHCEDITLSNNGVMNDSPISANLGLSGIPEISEVVDVAKILQIAKESEAKIVISNISSTKSLTLIKQAQKEGVDVKAQIGIHHILSDDSSCLGFNTYAKINPPLRDKDSVSKLRLELIDGNIDMISSMQSEFGEVYKDLTFDDAKFGIDIIQEYFALLYTNLVRSKDITLSKLSQLISYNPASLVKDSNMAQIKEGIKASIMIVDIKSSYKIENKNSLYNGLEVFGVIKRVYANSTT